MSTFDMPLKCCSCLGSEVNFKQVKKTFGLGTIQNTTYYLEVPVCKSCGNKMDWVITIGVAIRVVLIFLGVFTGLGMADDNETAAVIIAIGSIIGSHIIVTIYKRKKYPVRIDQSGNVSFTNKDYQALFVEANPENRQISGN